MVGSIILMIVGVMILLGIGSKALRDFGIPQLALVLLIALIVGLNFLPPVTFAHFSFGIGTGIFLLTTLFLLFFRGNLRNTVICIIVTVVLSAMLYGATLTSRYFNNTLFSYVNYYYAVIMGFLAFLATRNTKYGFISAVLSVAVVSLLTQTEQENISLDLVYSPAVCAGTLASFCCVIVTLLLPKKPNRMAYYYETGRMVDM